MTSGTVLGHKVKSDYEFICVCEFCGPVNECMTYKGASNSGTMHRNAVNTPHMAEHQRRQPGNPIRVEVFRAVDGEWVPAKQPAMF